MREMPMKSTFPEGARVQTRISGKGFLNREKADGNERGEEAAGHDCYSRDHAAGGAVAAVLLGLGSTPAPPQNWHPSGHPERHRRGTHAARAGQGTGHLLLKPGLS